MSNPAVAEDLNKSGIALAIGLALAQLPALFAMTWDDPISYLFRVLSIAAFGACGHFVRSALIEATGRDVLGIIVMTLFEWLEALFSFVIWLLFSRRRTEEEV